MSVIDVIVKSLIIIVNSSCFPCSTVNVYLTYFEAFLLSMYTLKNFKFREEMALLSLCNDLNFPDNFPCSELALSETNVAILAFC